MSNDNSTVNNKKPTMTIAHFGDVHVGVEKGEIPEYRRLLGKRLLATINLRYFGRGGQFKSSKERFQNLLQDIASQKPDFVISSGDFSSTSFPEEFKITSSIIQEEIPELLDVVGVIPGNHDRYTLGEVINDSFHRYFGPWMRSDIEVQGIGSKYIHVRLFLDTFAFIFIDTSRFHPLLSRGKVTRIHLNALEQVFSLPQLQSYYPLIVMHYPLLDAHGKRLSLEHGCSRIDALIELADSMEVAAIFSGHVHDNYFLPIPNTEILLINAGSATYSGKSTYNLYTLSSENIKIIRRQFDEEKGRFTTSSENSVQLRKKGKSSI